jgi:asparagine synthase (glutamine-hydrolysing)
MCGFISAFTASPFPISAGRNALKSIFRRGPDGEGEWRDIGVYLGHRRLSIIDLDERAAQPMHSACGRYIIVYNGEIYNYQLLRQDLEKRGVIFFTSSDTEVILALFAAEGEAMLPKLHGMFAFVIWDRVARKAFAARDPYGIKPLYIAKIASGVLLGSQVKALLATGLISQYPDPVGQAGFWMLGSVPEPHTWFRDIVAVQAGHCLWIEEGKAGDSRYWHDIGTAWRTAGEALSEDKEIKERVREALYESVSRHLVADVPVGVFLSGGIDSGAVAGLMVEAGAHELQGITLAYDEFSGRHEDEAPVAAQLAAHYGIKHHVRKVTQEEFRKDLPRILAAMDQPSIDGVNTWYASKAVAELGLKVVVSGVGGDELFLGYNSFRQLPRLVNAWSRLAKVPGALLCARAAAKWQAQRTGNSRWEYAPDWMQTMAGAWWLKRSTNAPDDLSELMHTDLPHDLLQNFAPGKWVTRMTGPLPDKQVLALAQIESMTYLRNQLLRDSDWASMDHSVELRTPLVDAHLLNMLQPLLSRFSLYPGKTLLAQAPQNPLPDVVAKRSKTGFAIPVKQWLVEELGPETTWQKTVAMHAGE